MVAGAADIRSTGAWQARAARVSVSAGLVAGSLRAHAVILVASLCFLGLSMALTSLAPDPRHAPMWLLVKGMLLVSVPAAAFVLIVIRLVVYIRVLKPASPIRALAADIRGLVLSPARWLNASPVILALLVQNKALIEIKATFPQINPFSWDETFMRLDRALHFGHDPWTLLQPLLGFPILTFAVNILYNFWFLVMFGMWFWFAFQDRFTALRVRFFLAVILAWFVGGGVAAVVFSSAGPCYFGDLGLAPNPFAPLMDYLYAVDARLPIWALDVQRMLWTDYVDHAADFIGISAFPSMHTAQVAIFALAAFAIDRRFGWAMTAYAAVILVGSVHLGWHYAVDAYAGVLIAAASWWAAGLAARWNSRREATMRFSAELANLRSGQIQSEGPVPPV